MVKYIQARTPINPDRLVGGGVIFAGPTFRWCFMLLVPAYDSHKGNIIRTQYVTIF